MGRETNDNLNRLTEIEYLPATIAGGQSSPASISHKKSTYAYDDISRLTSATNEMGTVTFGYDNRGRTTSTTDVFGRTIDYEYERTSAVNQKRLKLDGAMYAVYNFDDAERLANIVNSSDSTTISFGYDEEDKVISRTHPNGVTTTHQYFDNDLLKRITDTNSSGNLFDRQYLYNSARQISQIVEPARSRTFGYDNVDRLTSVTDATHGNEGYTFDDVGNRLNSHLSSNYGYQVGQFNRLTSATTPTQTVTYSHDANGNTTAKADGSNLWRYTWDYENRLGEAAARKQKAVYKYDALGRRVQRYVPGQKENTKFIHDGEDVLVDDNAGTLTKYINGEGIDNKLRQTTGSTASYFLADHLGSTTGLSNASGAITSQTAYDSFGNQTGALATRYGFTGRERDDFSGLMYYRARFYDPNLGRFASEDPVGFGGGDVNLYTYVRNNPHSFRDPSGKIIVPFIVGGIAVGALLLASPSYVNAPGPGDPLFDNRNDLVANAALGAACGLVVRTVVTPFVSKLLSGAGDDIIELGISGGRVSPAGGYAPKAPLPTQNYGGISDMPAPHPEAQGPHTMLGTRIGDDGVPYRQTATFPSTGNGPHANVPWSRVDWTTHARGDHLLPHQRAYNLQSDGTWRMGPNTGFSRSY